MLVLPPFCPSTHTCRPSSFSDIRFHYHSPVATQAIVLSRCDNNHHTLYLDTTQT
jgi:hypothetical protein